MSESMSKTMYKKMRKLSKNQLVDKLVETSNYAENMKGANLLLLYKVNLLTEKLNSAPQDVSAEVLTQSEGSSNEGT